MTHDTRFVASYQKSTGHRYVVFWTDPEDVEPALNVLASWAISEDVPLDFAGYTQLADRIDWIAR